MAAEKKNGKKKLDIDGLESLSRDIIGEIDVSDIEGMDIPQHLKDSVENAGALDEIEEQLGISVGDTDHAEDRDIIFGVPAGTVDTDEDAEEYEEEKEDADGMFDIKISDDRMSVTIDLYPSTGLGRPLSMGAIRTKINDMKIVYGLNIDLLERLVEKVEESKKEKSGIVIARGTPPKEGKNGSVEFKYGESDDIFNEE
ncbi:MAG: DUF342 domain-containing protein [Spirochaetes bacterium]|nr:DUF342 domain-containing protein [Spirochaetota bacterium]